MTNKKYPNNNFHQFLEMLSINYSDKKGRVELNEENVNDLILMFVYIEGEEQFHELKKELAEIVKNKDLKMFSGKILKELKDLEFVAEVVLKHN